MTCSGAFTQRVSGYPFMTGSRYYYRAVDAEDGGAGAQYSFLLLQSTPIPTATFGDILAGIEENDLNITETGKNLTEPYAGVFGGGKFGLMAFIGMFYMFIFVGLAIASDGIELPVMLGFIAAPAVYGLLPAEFQQVAYAIAIVSIAGLGYVIIRGWRRP